MPLQWKIYLLNTSKPLYLLYHPYSQYMDTREYLVVVHKDGKTFGYLKQNGWVRRQHMPQTHDMHFVGYMKEAAFEKMIFVDLI